jgi:1-deoxy-D-xylulose-5-phosphate synthase
MQKRPAGVSVKLTGDDFLMGGILEHINSPDDLKKLSVVQLKSLADEIRQFILSVVSKTGGHLASNLGVVELTLALHYAFDFKTDKLLWDVGHQCYTHKIVTGRKEMFKQLRQANGVSGFPAPAESVYDQFIVGHAGTAVATAIGMALGEQIRQKTEDRRQNIEYQMSSVERRTPKIVAVVGDASIVNGTSFEALNNLGLVKRQLLIVLNDNSMAIDTTVGAVAKYFSKVRLSHTYEDLRKTTKNILEHMPAIGKSVEEAIERIKKSIRMVLPASQLFESLNIPYFGPVDGYDIDSLIQLFHTLSSLNHPVVLHVYTKKGQGFSPADKEPSKFHSTSPVVTDDRRRTAEDDGQKTEGNDQLPITSNQLSFTEVFGEHLLWLAQKDSRIVAITSAMCDGTGLSAFRQRFPDRFYDVGIAESAAVDIAAGMAKEGLRPVVCIYSTFLQRSFDQIFQEVALQNLPVVFCIDRAGVVGTDGPTHHGLMDIGFLRMMPNMVLVAPSDDVEMRLALEFALREDKPICLRYPKDVIPPSPLSKTELEVCSQAFQLGKSVLVRKGRNSSIAIVTYGSVLTEALIAAGLLARDGIEVDVINARFAAPIDLQILNPLREGKGLITIEDHLCACGFGSAFLEAAAAFLPSILPSDRKTRGPIVVLGSPNRPIKHDLRAKQLMDVGINADRISRTAKEMLKILVTGNQLNGNNQ